MRVRRLNLLGGEPLLHPDLSAFLESARASGLAREIAVWTNGLLLTRVDERLFDLIDILFVTIYPGVALPLQPDQIVALGQRNGFVARIHHKKSFHVALLNQRIGDDRVVQQIYDTCAKAHLWSCHSFADGRYFKCGVADNLRGRLSRIDIPPPDQSGDSVPLHDNPHLRDNLREYIDSKRPLEACAWCLGTAGKQFPHHQLGRGGLAAEMSRDDSSVAKLFASDNGERSRRLHSLPLVFADD